MQVPYIDLGAQWSDIRNEALPLIDEVLSTGMYLEHELVGTLEENLAIEIGVKEVILVNSGTDALLMSLLVMNIKPGDEVITVPNSFIASVAAIQHVGAKPVMVDVGVDHLIDVERIEAAITSRTKAIMPVHLEGKVCNMKRINEIASKHGLVVIEDAAQAFGSDFSNVKAGAWGDISCFSLHPLKNLNACGDGGFVATNDAAIADRLRALRSHGQKERNNSEEFGFVSRFDSVQAAILTIRLKYLKSNVARRRENANVYDREFKGSKVLIPFVDHRVFHSYHLYVIEIENRDSIKEELFKAGIDTRVHYPKLITEQNAFLNRYGSIDSRIPVALLQRNRILSLPIHHYLNEEQISYVAQILRTLHG
jgi:dTDP-4-amino-4,6-dideoxygalactose transaminase